MVDNGESTFDLCSLTNGNLIRSLTFRSREVECRLPLQVAFASDGRSVIGGSDHGVAYVYDRKSAQVFDVLHHALDDEAVVQTVSVRARLFHSKLRSPRFKAFEHGGMSYVFTATSGRSRHPYISVWKLKTTTTVVASRQQARRRKRYACCPSLRFLFRLFVQFVMVATLALFVIQELSLFVSST